MSSYVITGVSRGMGWEFMKQLSSNPDNVVIGIVRDKPPTEKRIVDELGSRSNITILEGELTSYDSMKTVVSQAAAITGGRLDYLLGNAGQNMSWDAFDPIDVLAEKHEELNTYFRTLMDINVLANIHLYHLFMPQILQGKVKKVVHLTSALGDTDFTRNYGLYLGSIYASAKAAMNMITAHFASQYKKDGVLFLGVCPGVVDTGQFDNVTAEQMSKLEPMLQTWGEYAPDFKGPVSPESSVRSVLSVIEKCSVENGDSGAILSHLGTKQWL